MVVWVWGRVLDVMGLGWKLMWEKVFVVEELVWVSFGFWTIPG